MSNPDSKFAIIDSTLSKWAKRHSLHWFSEYQDAEVRSLVLNAGRRDQIQIAVDVPVDGQTVVRLGQFQRGLSRLYWAEAFSTPISTLSDALDRALQSAIAWRDEASG